jgi:hypothetical protein
VCVGLGWHFEGLLAAAVAWWLLKLLPACFSEVCCCHVDNHVPCTAVSQAPVWSCAQVLAEKAAFEMAQAHGLDVVTILPNFVMGPPLTADAAGTSIGFFKVCLEDRKVCQQLACHSHWGWACI